MTGVEMAEFAQLLPSLFLDSSALDAVLLPLDKSPLTRYVPANLSFSSQMVQLVAIANTEGWLIDLLIAVRTHRRTRPELQSFFARYTELDPSRNSAVLDPWNTHQLFGGKFFIGRETSRKYLRKMESPNGRKVLLVQSDSRFLGKTYTAELIHFVARQKPRTTRTYINLDSEEFEPGQLAARLALDWSMAPEALPKRNGEQVARWCQYLTRMLIDDNLNASGYVRWIVLDGFRERQPSVDLQEFINQLAERVQSNDSFRLLLLNYTLPLPFNIKPFTYTDTVSRISTVEIERAFDDIYRRLKNTTLAPDERAEYMRGLMDRLMQYQHQYPAERDNQFYLHCALADVVEEIA